MSVLATELAIVFCRRLWPALLLVGLMLPTQAWAAGEQISADDQPIGSTGPQAMLPLSIYFDFDVQHINPRAQQQLAELAKRIRQAAEYGRPALQYFLEGHSDTTGPAEYNMQLSLRRADAVRQFLLQLGVNPNQIIVRGFGEHKASEAASAKTQRRVELRAR